MGICVRPFHSTCILVLRYSPSYTLDLLLLGVYASKVQPNNQLMKPLLVWFALYRRHLVQACCGVNSVCFQVLV